MTASGFEGNETSPNDGEEMRISGTYTPGEAFFVSSTASNEPDPSGFIASTPDVSEAPDADLHEATDADETCVDSPNTLPNLTFRTPSYVP